MNALQSVPPVHLLVTYLFPAILIGIAFTCFTNTATAADMMGLNKEAEIKKSNPVWYLFGLRELSIGIALLLMMYYDQWKGVTIVMGCHGLSAIGDFTIDVLQGQGWSHGFQKHGLPTIIGYWVVWQLWKEQDW